MATHKPPMSGKIGPTTGQLMKGAQTRKLAEAITMDLHNVGIEEISGLEVCPKLCSLDVSFNKIAEMKNLESLKELRELKLYDNRIFYVKNLLALTALQTLDLSGNRVENIEGVSHLKQLMTLRLAHNKLTELRGLGKMPGLEILDVSYNKIQEIDGLQGCTALKELAMNGNKISKIQGLNRCSKLAELALNDNRLASLKGLREVSASLDILWVAENQLESLKGFPDSMPKLTELYISENKLTSLQPLDKCCPAIELLDVSRNKLASVKRLEAALSPLQDLAELKAEGNPICHQPEGQPPYRNRVLLALPSLRYLDEEEVTDIERMWLKHGGGVELAADPSDPELLPTAEEMEEFKQRMGIHSNVPSIGGNILPGGSAGLRPDSAAASSRPLSRQGSLSRHNSMTGSRPGTASLSLPAGTGPVGPLGRPSTPRAQGQAVVPSAAVGNPLMTRRPPSARSSASASLMKPEQYETSLAQFTDTMDEYQMQMQAVVSQLRAGLVLDLPEATAAVRAAGMSGPETVVTAGLPKPPQLPTFATRSDTDAALKREARAQVVAKAATAAAEPQGTVTATNASIGSSQLVSAPASRPQPSPAADVSSLMGHVGTGARAAVPGVSDSINNMPTKASELLEYYSRLFPAEAPDIDEQTSAGTEENQAPKSHAETPAEGKATVDSGSLRRPRGYTAAGGFTRVDMDDLPESSGHVPVAWQPSGLAGVSHGGGPTLKTTLTSKFSRVDMGDDDGMDGYSTAAAQAPERQPSSIQAKLAALEQMVSDYGSAATEESSGYDHLLASVGVSIEPNANPRAPGGEGVVLADTAPASRDVYHRFKLPSKTTIDATNLQMTATTSGNRLAGGGTRAAADDPGGDGAIAHGAGQRPLSGNKLLAKRAPGGMLGKKR